MANKKKKKQQSLGTASARAEKVATKKQTTASSSSVVAKNSPFSKASQQTAKPKQQTPKPKQTAPAPKQTGPSVRSSASQNRATVEKRIESTANQQRKNWNQAAKAYDKKNGSASTRIAKASKELTKSKDDLYNKGGNYGKYMYNTLENEVYTKAKNHAGDADYKKLIKDSDFTKEQKAEIKTLHGEHLKGLDKSASFDLDKSAFQSTFEKWKESSQNPKKKKKKEQAAVSDALGNVEGKRESVAAKAQSEKEQKTAKGKARTAFEVADADFRIAESNANDAMEAVKNAFKVAEEDPTEENIAAYNALYAQGEQAYNDYVLAADNAKKAQVAFEKQMRYGKGNIDLMNLPKDDKGRTIAFDTGNYEKEYGEDTSQYQANDPTKIIALLNKKKGTTFVHKDEDGKYVLIPNYIETEDGWQRLSGEDEAWKAYQQTGKYFGKFNSEEEANAYISELQDAQRKAMGSIYGQQLSEYNDLKAEEKKAKKEMKAAQSAYEEIAMSGASKKEVAAAKKKADTALKAFESASDAKDKYKSEHPDVQTDWAGLTGNTIYSGATELAYEAAGFAELVANAFDKDNDNGVSRYAEFLGKKRQEQSEFGQYLAGNSKIAKGMNMFGPSIVAMVPMMAASMFGAAGEAMTTAEGLSRSGHIAKATQALAKTAAIEAGQVGKAEALLATIAQGMYAYAHDPGFETSFVQVTGGSYAEAIKDGYTEGQAISQAVINGTLASIIEVGELGDVKLFGGVNNFNKMRRLLSEGKFGELYKTVVMSPFHEGLEELAQGVVERSLQNVTANAKNPFYSTEDPNAIINPTTMGQEALGGFLGGLVMGGGVGGAIAGYNAVQNARQSFQQSVIGQALQSTQYDIIMSTLSEYDPASKSYQMAEEMLGRLDKAGLTKTETDEKGNIKAPENLTAKEVSKLISKKELGELAQQKMLDQSKYWLGSALRGNETATTRGVSQFAQSLTENARRTNDQTSQAYRKEVDAHEMDKVLRDLVDTGGEITTDEKGNVVDGVTDEAIEHELNKWQYNEPGFKNTINQYFGAEVLTDDIATTEDIITALRERAAQMREQTISLAEMAKTRTVLEASDNEEAEETAQELASQAMGEAVAEQVEAEQQAQENAQVMAEMDEDFASLAASEPPAKPGSIEEVAQQTSQKQAEQQEHKRTSEENAALLEREANRLEKEGSVEIAEDLRQEAQRLRSLSNYTDGQERVIYDSKPYTRDELFEYLQQRREEGEFTEEEVTREYSDMIFDLAKEQEFERALNARNSVTGAGNVQVKTNGRLPNETQSIMGNIIGLLASKRGVTAVRWVSDAELNGAAAEYTLDGKEIKLNIDRLTTQAAVEKEVGHEFFHTGSDILAAAVGENLNSEAGDFLTNQVIDAFQRAATKLYNKDRNDPVNAGIYLKYVETFDDLLRQRTEDYLIQNLLTFADAHNIKVTPSSKSGIVSLDDLRRVIPGAIYNEFVDQITGEGTDRENAYVRQEIAADWMGEIAGQQSLLERLAEDDPRLLYRLGNTVRRLRTRLAGATIDVGPFSMITSNKDFVKSLDKITETVATALRRAEEVNIQTIEENTGKATVADQLLAEARQSRPTTSTPQYQNAERLYRKMRDEYQRRGNLEKVAYYDKGLEVMRKTAEGLDQEYRDDWYDTPENERTIENLPDELQPGTIKDYIESWKYQYDDAMDPNFGYEAFGPANHLAIPRTPRKAGYIGMNTNEAFSMPITTAMNSSGIEVTDLHSTVHEGQGEAVRNAPEWIEESFFISNNPSKHPGLGVNQKTGKLPPMGVWFFTPHLDEEGHVIMYTVCPDVEGTANVHGISGIAANVTATVFGRPNFFGEYTAYDRVLDEEKKRIDNSDYSPEQKAAFKKSLDKYYAVNQLKAHLEVPEGKTKARVSASALGLYPQKYRRGKVQEHWKETGTFADNIRSADSLYLELNNAKKFANEMTKYWKQKWADWVDAAQTSENRDSEWIPPPVPPIQVPTQLLRSRRLSENGVHKHNFIPEWSSQNGVDTDRRNGTYAGYTMAHTPGYNGHAKISLDELGKKSVARQLEGSRQSQPTPAEIQARPFVATHSQRDGSTVLEALKRDIMFTPSTAMTTPKIAIASGDKETFGRYVFILKRQAVDPGADSRNTVYGGDFYSPNRSELPQNYPERYLMTEEDSNRFEDYMTALANSFYGATDYSPWEDKDAFHNQWKHTKRNSTFQVSDYDYTSSGKEGRSRSWHDLLVTSPERYASKVMQPTPDGKNMGIKFFADAYLSSLGYRIDPDMPAETIDEHRARLLKRAEIEAVDNVDFPSLQEWIATQYANYITAHGRKNLDAKTSYKTEDLYPDNPIESFWNDNMEVNEENDVAALYEHGEKAHYLSTWSDDNAEWEIPEFLIATLKPKFESLDEARAPENYETLRKDHDSYRKATNKAVSKARNAAFEIYKEMAQLVAGKLPDESVLKHVFDEEGGEPLSVIDEEFNFIKEVDPDKSKYKYTKFNELGDVMVTDPATGEVLYILDEEGLVVEDYTDNGPMNLKDDETSYQDTDFDSNDFDPDDFSTEHPMHYDYSTVINARHFLTDILKEAVITEEGIADYATSRGFSLLPSTIKAILDIKDAAQQIPVLYYEAKPKRYLKPSEDVGAMVLPDDADPQIFDWLKKHNIPYQTVSRYDDLESVREAVRSFTNLRFSVTNDGKVHGFYSELQNAINGSKQNKMKPEQWLQYAKGHGQVKQEEIDYSGILELPDESITKEDLLDYLRANEIELEETVLSGDTHAVDENDEQRYRRYQYLIDGEYQDYDKLLDYVNEWERDLDTEGLLEDLEERGANLPDDRNPDNYMSNVDYNIVGIDNNRLMLTAQVWYRGDDEDDYGPWELPLETLYADLDTTNENTDAKWGDFSVPGNTNYREILLKIPNSEYTNFAMKGHWKEKGKGILAHARVDDFTNENGEKILFVEEIQSDWHNAGQKSGYEVTAKERNDRLVELRQAVSTFKAGPTWKNADTQIINLFIGETMNSNLEEELLRCADAQDFVLVLRNAESKTGKQLPPTITDDDLRKLYNDTEEDVNKIRELRQEAYKIETGAYVPDAPYKESYVSLTLKRLLREAVENGYDRLAWTTPEMQADRWDMGGGEGWEFIEGYTIEYGQQIPKFLSKYVKKWGSKVEPTTLAGSDRRSVNKGNYYGGLQMIDEEDLDDIFNRDTMYDDDIVITDGDIVYRPAETAAIEDTAKAPAAGSVPFTVQSIPITDAMRESISTKGQPRFSAANRTDNQALNRKLYELIDTENRLQRILGSDLTDNVRRTVERELGQARAGINALRAAYEQDRARTIANTKEGAGQIINIPDARVTTPEDMLHTVLQSATSNMTADEIIDMAYRSIGYRENSPTPQRQWKQSQVNTNTYTHAIDGFFSEVISREEDAHARAEMLSIASRLKGEGQYLQITNKQTIESAKRRLHENFDAERERLERDEKVEWGAEDVCVSMGILAADLASRDPERFMKTAEMIRKKGTQAGQLIQAFKMFNKTPEGVLVDALHDLNEADLPDAKRKQLMESIQDLAQTLSSLKNNDLDGLIDVILRQAKIRNTKVSKLTLKALKLSTYEANYERAMNQLRMIPRDYLQKSTGEKISTYQVLSHLLNIKTGMRNIIANFMFNDLDSALAHNVAFGVDRILSAISGQSSVGRMQMGGMFGGNKFAGALRGAREEAINVNLDIDPFNTAAKYRSSKRTWTMVGNKGSQAMSTLEKMLGWELNVSDEFSKGMIYEQSMRELTPLVEQGVITQADAEAAAEWDMRYRTFQDETVIGNMLGGLHDTFNLVGIGDSGKKIRSKTVHAFGLGDLVCKYTTVPGALITRSLEFSPLGYLKLTANLYSWGKQIKALNDEINSADPDADWVQKAKSDLFFAQRKAALTAGRATTGSGLILLFAFLSGTGILNDEDEGGTTKEKKYETVRGLEGVSGLQLNINALNRVIKTQSLSGAKWREGDELVSVAFLEPFNALMSVGSLITDGDEYKSLGDMWKDLGEDKSGIFWNSVQGMWNAIADLPTMQTIGSIQQSAQYYNPETDGDNPFVYGALEFAKSNITGFVPAPVRQVAQAQDEFYRDAYYSENPMRQVRDVLQSTIPEVSEDLNFSRQDLPTKLTPIGEDKTSPDSVAMRVFNAVANPGTTHAYTPGELYGKLDEVYEATGDASFYPDRAAPRKLDFGEELKLTPEQRREYQTQYGKDYTEQINKAMSSEKYQNASMEEKATILNDARTWAMKLTKYEMAKQFGTDYGDADVVENRLAKEATVSKMKLTMDAYETIKVGMQNPETGNAKQDFAKPYLESRSDLSGRQKYELWHMQWDSDKNNPYTKYKNDPY